MITSKEKLKVIDSDLAFMKKWYPQRIEDGKIGKDFAAYKIEVYQAIKSDYVDMVRDEAALPEGQSLPDK